MSHSDTGITGKVAGILNPREIAINRGKKDGVQIEMVFKIMAEATLKDPDTDEVLDTFYHEKGRVKIVKVKKKYSIARTFETYEVNVGGYGVDTSDLFKSLATGTASARIIAPPRYVTRVKTLEYGKSGLEYGYALKESTILVSVGDVVELVDESNNQESSPRLPETPLSPE